MRLRTAIPLGAAALAAGVVAYGSLIERTRWTLRRFDVPTLDPEAEPLRILHLSDLHMLPEQRSKQEWIERLAGLDPDLVLVTGDNLASPTAVPSVLNALAPLMEYPGAFVFGSNDYYAPTFINPLKYLSAPSSSPKDSKTTRRSVPLPWGKLRDAFLDAGWIDLTNRRALTTAGGRRIELAGVDDPHIHRDQYEQIKGPPDPEADLNIGVVHSPEPRVLDSFARDGFGLIVAGHTHGGQICIPGYGALTTNSNLPTQYARGLHRWGDSWLHVSAGLGTSPYFPIRVACPPEASILTLIPAAS